jgi:predicted DNA-binding transcriptional regulator AlpA
MLRNETLCNVLMKKPKLLVRGDPYVPAAELCRTLGISRQTLWRWRQNGSIPAGARYRDRVVVFTEQEAEQIRDFAHRVVPLGADLVEQKRSSR